jgi:hypothetical protein
MDRVADGARATPLAASGKKNFCASSCPESRVEKMLLIYSSSVSLWGRQLKTKLN